MSSPSSTATEIRTGTYYDSIVLMQLQRGLATLPGVEDAGVVMGTDANKDLLAQSGLASDNTRSARADDLIIVIRADSEPKAPTNSVSCSYWNSTG